MSFQAAVLKVLIASPGDTKEYRDLVEGALHDWNGARGEAAQTLLLPRRWETDAVPLAGADPQSVINSQLVDDADVVFGVFHTRLGRRTPRAPSGTAEELARNEQAGKPVHIYFAAMPIPWDHDPQQFAALQEFRQELERRTLVGRFETAEDLRKQVHAAVEFDVAMLASQPRGPREVQVNQSERSVPPKPAFSARNAPRQELFAKVLDRFLEAHPEVRRPTPADQNWISFASGPFGLWALSVTNRRLLRVEAYLDTGDRGHNKRLFDQFHDRAEVIERELGFSLSWERLDDKKASRIAAYSADPVEPQDPTATEAEVAWAATTLLRMYERLNHPLRTAAAEIRGAGA